VGNSRDMASRFFRATLVACALAVFAGAPSATAAERPAKAADRFTDSVGVNVHLHFQGSAYDRAFQSVIKPKLEKAGIRHLRDGAYTYREAASSLYYRRCRELAAAGIRFNLLTSFKTHWSEPTDYSKLAEVYRWCGRAVESFEGVNEPDLQPIPAGFPDWKTQTVQSQKALYKAVKGSPAIRHVDVLGPTVVWAPTALGDLSAYMDYGNWHPYPGGQCPTCGDAYGQNVDTFLPKYRTISGDRPMIASETGYHNAINQGAGGHRPASEEAAGKYVPRLLLELFNRGFARTYLYELIDSASDASRTKPDANLSPLRHDGSEKPAFRALTNLLRITDDPGPRFEPRSLDYTLGGSKAGLHQTLLQKRDGTFLLALWLERSSYDTGARPNQPDNVDARGDVAVQDQAITVTLDRPFRSAAFHRFRNDGTTARVPVPARLPTRMLKLAVSERLTVIELKMGR
jgi:hypothetical protein